MVKHALKTMRKHNFPEWYQEVVTRAELADNSVVRGCMVIRPYGYAIWENIQKLLDAKIKGRGVQNAYFPLLIPLEFLEKEARHIEGFAKECAVVTHHRLKKDENGRLMPEGKLEAPYIIRPTSETIIGESFSKWIRSYRDLPMKINQWANIMRWEMRPRVFLRTSEFLWQEGHNVFATAEEAETDVLEMLEVYQELMTKSLAIYGLAGKKTEDEKFPGAVNTYTIEAMMQDGKALQSCTSHNLGQNFTKSSGIKFTGMDGQERFAYSTSWGMSTRIIGALIMSHSDDDGLVLPPVIAPYKAVIIPIINDEGKAEEILTYCKKLREVLGEKVLLDDSAKSVPDKKWDWIRKGAPIIIEIGTREVNENTVSFVRRDDVLKKQTMGFDEFVKSYEGLLDELHKILSERNKTNLKEKFIEVDDIAELSEIFKKENKFVSLPARLWGNKELNEIMKENKLSYRCLPFEMNERVIVGKSY
jgi:prolyl-tRNA synthetase